MLSDEQIAAGMSQELKAKVKKLLNKTRSFFGHMGKSLGLISIFPMPVWHQYKNTIVRGFAAVWADLKIKMKLNK